RFPPEVATPLLIACHRRCCICHRFCGVKMELDHIVQAADGGRNSEDNAIPVCFDCHAEIHSYNDRHPKGTKFCSEDLRGYKNQCFETRWGKPDTQLSAARDTDVGPLQAVINELEFNRVVAKHPVQRDRGCLFKDHQFNRAISQGALWMVTEDLKNSI